MSESIRYAKGEYNSGWTRKGYILKKWVNK
jgi:hypothetical protein